MKTNIALRILDYYESDDFKDNYSYLLIESFNNDRDVIIDRIYNLFNVSNYEVKKNLSNCKYFDKKQCAKIFDFIEENIENFVKDFSSYWVGPTSLSSISFGEQETQLEGIYNYRNKKEYNLKYLKKIFEENNFYVSDNYAYYDLSDSGLHIDLLNDIELLNNFLKTL